jgi:hypothetical protein
MASTGSREALVPKEREEVPGILPESPKPVRRSAISVVSDLCLDVFFLMLSLVFFAFGLTIRSYDQASTITHPRLTKTLSQATTYVFATYHSFIDAVSLTFY